MSWSWSTRDQYRNCGCLEDMSSFHSLNWRRCWSSVSAQRYFWYAKCCMMYRAAAVIWCARLVLITCPALTKKFTIPEDALPAISRTLVHPEQSSHCPSAFNAVISMWSPPNMITKCSSPYVSGHCHWICFARANSGWSTAITGTCPGFLCSVANLTTFSAWRIIATECAFSRSMGMREMMASW